MSDHAKIKCPNCDKEIPTPSDPGEILCTGCGKKINFIGNPMEHFRNRLSAAVFEANQLGIHIEFQILTIDLLHDELLVMRRMEAAKQASGPPLIVPAHGIKPNRI